MEPVVEPQVLGTIQYLEWLILIDRVQPSFITGVRKMRRTQTACILTGRGRVNKLWGVHAPEC